MSPSRASPSMLRARQSWPSKRDGPAVGNESGDRPQRRGLPGAVGPDQRDHLATRHAQIDAPHREDRSVGHVELTDLQHDQSTSAHTEIRVDDALVLEHGRRISDGDEVAELEHRDPVTEAGDEVQLVVDDEQRDTFVAQVTEISRELRGLRVVETGGRFVEHQHLRLRGNGAGDLEQPSLAVGEPPGRRLGVRAEPHPHDRIGGTSPAFALVPEHGGSQEPRRQRSPCADGPRSTGARLPRR